MKKLYFVLLAATVISVSAISAIGNENIKGDMSLEQIGAGCVYGCATSEGSSSTAWGAAATGAFGYSAAVLAMGGPVGWVIGLGL